MGRGLSSGEETAVKGGTIVREGLLSGEGAASGEGALSQGGGCQEIEFRWSGTPVQP